MGTLLIMLNQIAQQALNALTLGYFFDFEPITIKTDYNISGRQVLAYQLHPVRASPACPCRNNRGAYKHRSYPFLPAYLQERKPSCAPLLMPVVRSSFCRKMDSQTSPNLAVRALMPVPKDVCSSLPLGNITTSASLSSAINVFPSMRWHE